MTNRDFGAAVEQLESGWKSVRWIPGQGELRKALEAQLDVARRGRVARAVHDLVEQLRFLDSYDAVPIDQLRQLDTACERLWSVREKLAPLAGSALQTPEWAALRPDLTDLVISWAGLKTRLDRSGEPAALRRNVLGLFDQAEALCGSSFALELARREYAAQRPSEAMSAAPLKPQTADEHNAMGRYLFRSDKFSEAAAEFERAIELDPHGFWNYFYLTLCAYRLEDFDRAIHAADLCIALSPQSAPCFYNRALCHQRLGHAAKSLNDLTRAIELDPGSSVAWLRRGMVHRELHQYPGANDDFTRALAHSANPAEVYYQMALVEVDLGHPEAALDRLRLALQHDATFAAALALQARLQSRP